MTRDEALNDWYDCNRQIELLKEKASNLKKIIFSEVGVPQQAIPKHDRMQGNIRSRQAPRGKSTEAVVKAMSEHGGQLTIKELSILTGFTTSQLHGVLFKLKKSHFVYGEHTDHNNPRSTIKWSLAVHRDKSELNHV